MEKRIDLITRELNDKKAEDILVFDLRDKDYFVDCVVIATSMGERHGLSLLDHLKTTLKANGESFINIDASPDWIVIDLGDLLIHILTENFRAKYNLEEFLTQRKEEIIKQKI
ncbi:MAG: ribosome silencing factor [Campylobacteraceae bacterium]